MFTQQVQSAQHTTDTCECTFSSYDQMSDTDFGFWGGHSTLLAGD